MFIFCIQIKTRDEYTTGCTHPVDWHSINSHGGERGSGRRDKWTLLDKLEPAHIELDNSQVSLIVTISKKVPSCVHQGFDQCFPTSQQNYAA